MLVVLCCSRMLVPGLLVSPSPDLAEMCVYVHTVGYTKAIRVGMSCERMYLKRLFWAIWETHWLSPHRVTVDLL